MRSIASRPRWIGCEGSQGRTFFKALQQRLRWDLGAEAAGVGFAGGEGAVFPEFVAAVALLALGNQLTFDLRILKQADPVGVPHRFDPGLDVVGFGRAGQLLGSGVGGAGFGGLAEHGAGGQQCLKQSENASWLLVDREQKQSRSRQIPGVAEVLISAVTLRISP